MTALLVALLAGVMALQAFSIALQTRRPPAAPPPAPPVEDDALRRDLNALISRYEALQLKVDGLPSLWETERKNVERAANAIRVSESRAKKRARKELEDGDADPNLSFDDEGTGFPERVPAVRESVGARAEPSTYATAMIGQSLTSLKAI